MPGLLFNFEILVRHSRLHSFFEKLPNQIARETCTQQLANRDYLKKIVLWNQSLHDYK